MTGPPGSSPLTRGKRVGSLNDLCQIRLIPAHAGKTGAVWLACAACAAHPRSRGENESVGGGEGILTGSSPLTRGKHIQESHGVAPSGLIPAHAGKTFSRPSAGTLAEAHPRSRGENNTT